MGKRSEFCYQDKGRSQKKHQELKECMRGDNTNRMLLLSILLMLIFVINKLCQVFQIQGLDDGNEMFFLALLGILFWYLIHYKKLKWLKVEAAVLDTFWLLVNIIGLKGLYLELLLQQSNVHYYILILFLTGFYICPIYKSVLWVLFDTSVMIVMLQTIGRSEDTLKNQIAFTVILAIVSTFILYCHSYFYGLEKKEQFHLRAIGEVDRLTGLLNRSGFEEKVSRIWDECRKNETAMTAIMADIDYFKIYNDTFGHVAGDQCLKDISACIYEVASQRTNLIVRYGGEEIVVILTECKEEACIELAHKLREGVIGLQIKAGREAPYEHVTVSIGIASVNSNEINSIYELIQKADEQLYHSKKNGRNKIMLRSASIDR